MATYLILGLIVLAALAVVARPTLTPGRAWLVALTVLLVMTAIFDSLIVGFGIVAYDPAKILGVYIGHAPIEDFAYTIGALIIVPILWRSAKRGTDE